jgi:dienelactone hydrolase
MRILCFLLLGTSTAFGQAPSPKLPGEGMIRGYFQRQAKEIAAETLAEYDTKAKWEAARPERKRQLLEMLGLWPLPAKTDLKATVTGIVDTPKFTVEKVQFQSLPNLYVTANLYIPKPAPVKAPVILYVCGHGNVVKDGVSYGSKVYYQHHAAWYAEHGYVCIVIDTLQLSEIPGLHHGTYREGMWWWHAKGYTPAGVECWNAMRTLDYLETRPECDMKRVGVTGRSGGGAYSWWIAATDERIACAVPVAGIADLQAHLNEGYPGRLEKGVIAGHCDCMFMVNTYRWDFAMVAALIAPRPVLLGNSDNDDIFPVGGYRRLAEKTRKIYELSGAGDKFQLLETKGTHEDTLELRLGEYRWMNKWLKNDGGPVEEGTLTKLTPEQLRVLKGPPEGAINATVQESFIKPANVQLPQSAEVARSWWPARKAEWETALKEKVFRNWPAKPGPLNERPAKRITHDGVRLDAWDFTSEEGIDLRLWLMSAGDGPPKRVVLNVLDEAGYAEWARDLGPAFAGLLPQAGEIRLDAEKFGQNKAVMASRGWAFAAVCPRGIGPTKWAVAGSTDDIQYRRRFALVGQTLDGMRVWDVRRAIDVLSSQAATKAAPLWLQGNGEPAGIALMAGIANPAVQRLDLRNMPSSFMSAPTFLNVLRHFDVPQAVALAMDKPVRISLKDDAAVKAFAWPRELHQHLGLKTLEFRTLGE